MEKSIRAAGAVLATQAGAINPQQMTVKYDRFALYRRPRLRKVFQTLATHRLPAQSSLKVSCTSKEP
ncbi:hypothetical protein TNCV_4048771 [Trichonephila clavipes]|nr:hypothetical protein TNCV_4048771 [Trichonephila clavipes]